MDDPKRLSDLLKLIGDEMTINPISMSQLQELRWKRRYGVLKILLIDTLLPVCYFGKNSPFLAKIGWSQAEVVAWLKENKVPELGPVKRAPKQYPIYD